MGLMKIDIENLKANTLHLFLDEDHFNECLEDKLYELETLDEYVELHRVIFVDDFYSINTADLGRHWVSDRSTLDRELLNYLKNECECGGIEGEPHIISAIFPKFAIDSEMSIEQHMLNPNEAEIFVKKGHKPVHITSIEKVDMGGNKIDYSHLDFDDLKSIGREIDHTYLVGDCHSFAIALNRVTNYPMISIMRKHLLPEDEWFSDDEYDKYDYEHAHAAVLIGNSIYLDAHGVHLFDPEDKNLMFAHMGEDTSDPYFLIYEGEENLASNYADYDEEIIQGAMKDIENFKIMEVIERYKSLLSGESRDLRRRSRIRP